MITAAPAVAALETAGIEQLAVGLLGAENVGVHVVIPEVAMATCPTTVNVYLLSAQLPSVVLSTVNALIGQ